MSGAEDPKRFVLVAVDMEKYSRRDNPGQYRAQQTFQRVMAEAVNAAGLQRAHWTTQQAGDGELAVVPPEASESEVVARLVPALDRILRQHNRGLLPEAKVRLRVAIHQGLVHLDGANGFPGDAVIEVCRLRDSDVLRHTLAWFKDASVALIVSETIFQDVVRHGYHGVRAERFAPVEVTVKEFNAPAWIYVPDEDANTMPGTAAAVAGAPAPAPQPRMSEGSGFTSTMCTTTGQRPSGRTARPSARSTTAARMELRHEHDHHQPANRTDSTGPGRGPRSARAGHTRRGADGGRGAGRKRAVAPAQHD